ncbi:MAG: hypothetical protein ABI574_19465 [Burkholderiales bacterium]
MRVNARFEGESERQMEFLTQATGLGVTEVLKASVTHYFALLRGQHKPRLAHLRPLIGTQGSGRSDVASRTKEVLAEGFGRSKTPEPAAKAKDKAPLRKRGA